MQYVQQSPAARTAAQQRTLAFAWLILLGGFTLFVVIVAWAGLSLRSLYRTTMQPLNDGATLFVRAPTETIAWRPADRTIYQGVIQGQILSEGDTLRTAAAAGYGQVASVLFFEQSQLDLWAGSELIIERLRSSRWHSGTLEMAVRQQAGYVRYDLTDGQPFGETTFHVLVGDAVVDLALGGSYSLDLRPSERLVQRIDGGNTLEADLAVRSGSALVHGSNGSQVTLGPDQHVLIDAAGIAGLPIPARWELISDGGFSQFSEEEYNNTTLGDPMLVRSRSWQVYSGPDLPPAQQGFFRLASTCRPPFAEQTCIPADRRTAAWFYRPGGQTSSFTTGIKQELGLHGAGIDISEYRTLRFSLWARVLYQSLADAGDRGVECPVMIRLVAKRSGPGDPEEQRDFCVYIDEDQVPPTVTEPGMVYFPVPVAEWAQISFDLRELDKLPDYRYLRRIQIFAQGHDYDSRVAEISLIGEQ